MSTGLSASLWGFVEHYSQKRRVDSRLQFTPRLPWAFKAKDIAGKFPLGLDAFVEVGFPQPGSRTARITILRHRAPQVTFFTRSLGPRHGAPKRGAVSLCSEEGRSTWGGLRKVRGP